MSGFNCAIKPKLIMAKTYVLLSCKMYRDEKPWASNGKILETVIDPGFFELASLLSLGCDLHLHGPKSCSISSHYICFSVNKKEKEKVLMCCLYFLGNFQFFIVHHHLMRWFKITQLIICSKRKDTYFEEIIV